MKKHLLLIILILSVVVSIPLLVIMFFLCGCSETQGFQVYSISGFENDSSFFITDSMKEKDLGYKEFEDVDIITTKEYFFLGKEYYLEYMSSMRKAFTSYEEDEYYSDEDVSFCFKRGSGELTAVFSAEGIPINNGILLECEDDYRAVAESLLSSYIDISEYEYSCRTEIQQRKVIDGITDGYIEQYDGFVKTESDGVSYYFIYDLKYYGFNTSESAVVVLNQDGAMEMLLLNSIGEFRDLKKININCQAVEKAVRKKVSGLCRTNFATLIDLKDYKLCKKGKEMYLITTVYITITENNTKLADEITYYAIPLK